MYIYVKKDCPWEAYTCCDSANYLSVVCSEGYWYLYPNRKDPIKITGCGGVAARGWGLGHSGNSSVFLEQNGDEKHPAPPSSSSVRKC